MVEDTCWPPWCTPRTGGAETILVAIESNRKHDGCVSQRYRFDSRWGDWALFSLMPSALSFVFLWHMHTGSVLSQVIWFRHDGDCTLLVLYSENPSRCGRPSPCHSGDCAYNATLKTHVCVCPSGLMGDKCQTGKTMHIQSSFNLFLFFLWPAECVLYSKCRYSPSSEAVAFSLLMVLNIAFLYQDVDECSTGQHDCDIPERSICNNTHGSYLCHCRHGYCGEDGRHCKGEPACSTSNLVFAENFISIQPM